ncbi:hypothetical protein TWF281_010488 [Arthrobotrys megalospora]
MYPHPLDVYKGRCLGRREQYLRNFSHAVRSKPNWTEKILDRALVAKWLREAAKQDNFCPQEYEVITWDRNDIDFVYTELVEGYKAYVEEMREKGLPIEPDIDGVWRADGLIDEALRKELMEAVSTLENVPDSEKDWHPGSKQQVLDLVHPSLWPIIYRRTVNAIDGKPIEAPKEASEDRAWDSDDDYAQNDEEEDNLTGWSKDFCWLPTEFEISDSGETTIISYINNLALPEQKALFNPIISRVFTKFIPLFNHVLGDMATDRHDQKRTFSPDEWYWEYKRVDYVRTSDYENNWEKLLRQFENGKNLTASYPICGSSGSDDGSESEGSEDSEDSEDSDGSDPGKVEIWDLGNLTGTGWKPPVVTNRTKLEGKTAKVIVKLANIVLTPEKPSYSGGTWHIEAMKNERIIATGIYYYDQENVTDSKLSFRRLISLSRIGGDGSNWAEAHGMESGWGIGAQELGSVKTQNNRAIAFPNIFQHCVSSFELIDKTKPGHRKILVFFLCDPGHEVPTTRTVEPQQPEARFRLEESMREGKLGKLPEEIFSSITKELPPIISLAEAKRYRELLMQERSGFNKDSKMVKGRSYSLCEH